MKLFLPGLILLLCAAAARAAPDDDFLAAREAFRVGDAARLDRYAAGLRGYVLEPYIVYWQLKLHLADAEPADVRAVLSRIKDGPMADRLRADWLKQLGMKQQWPLFDTEYPRLVGEDPEITCYALRARQYHESQSPAADFTPRGVPLPSPEANIPAPPPAAVATNAPVSAPVNVEAGDAPAQAPPAEGSTAQIARALWLTGRELPDACGGVFDAMVANHTLGEADVWGRIRRALQAGNTGVVASAAAYLPAEARPDPRVLAAIATNPQRYLDRRQFQLATRAGRETLMFAVLRLARTSPPLAAGRWERLGASLPEDDRRYVWGVIAALGAQRLDPNTLRWFERAGTLDDAQLGWKTRTALRAGLWREVLASIEAMSAATADDDTWRYWRARALSALGRPAEARSVLVPLAAEMNFYGQLAAEDLGGRNVPPAAAYQPSPQEVAAAGAAPGLQRALAFYRLNLRFEANREWNWTVRTYDDKRLLAAAEFAQRNGLYDRAIYTAERTQRLHDFAMRYPTPYRDVLAAYAQQQQLDEAWVYGLIRQESRFVEAAHSSAGASGLMQLMPRTASWVARKIGLHDYSSTRIAEVDTNLNLGTWYLRHVLDELDSHPVLASAAYNAGPRRAREWRNDRPLEGAVYAETIPFRETREYVKKVMSNAAYYSQQLGLVLQSLRARLGVVAPNRPSETPLDEPAT